MSNAHAHSAPDQYTDAGFWSKVRGYANVAGREVIHKALCLFYSYQDPATPARAKLIIAGALGYFILPLDAIPDVLPVVGYTDDLGAMAAAIATVAAYITKDHIRQADDQVKKWFDA